MKWFVGNFPIYFCYTRAYDTYGHCLRLFPNIHTNNGIQIHKLLPKSGALPIWLKVYNRKCGVEYDTYVMVQS